MARPRQFDEAAAIEAAMELFWIRGYRGTSLPDLLEAMALTRGSFYKAFDDKHSVYLRALQYYDTTRMETALAHLTDRTQLPPRDRLAAFFQRTEDNPSKPAPKIGCFVCNTMVELAPFDAECAEICNQIAERLMLAIRSVLQEISPDWSSDTLNRRAVALQKLYLGAHAMGRTGIGFDAWPDLLDDLLQSP